MSLEYAYNYNILCAACNKPRYMGYTYLPDGEMCCCMGQDKISTYNKGKELSDEALLYASEEDWAFYKKIADELPSMAGKNNDGLDKFGIPIPYHSGPHILRHFMDTIDIVKPNEILEIGFNMGHSSMMWLTLTDAKCRITSVDVSEKDETIKGVDILNKKYSERFSYWNRNSEKFNDHLDDWTEIGFPRFDLCFIDGAHDEKSIIEDTEMCINLKIPYILYDDYYPRYAETQKALTHFPELELVKDMNNLRLYRFNYDNKI